MAKKVLLARDENWYKVNLHAHTTLSDGCWTPEETKARYVEQGYAAVAYTDHRVYIRHDELTDERFVALPAIEINIDDTGKEAKQNTGRTWHLNFYDTGAAPRGELPKAPADYGDVDAINAYIAEMNRLGFICCYNHPYWSLQTQPEYTALRGLFAMEIYNHGCGHEGNYGYAPQAYDEMLRAAGPLCCVAADDNHNGKQEDAPLYDSFGGWVMVQAPAPSQQALTGALQAGRFYASTGPGILGLELEGDTLTVATTPVRSVHLNTEGRGADKVLAKGGNALETASFTLKPGQGYVRLTCTDDAGRVACTRAYFEEELRG